MLKLLIIFTTCVKVYLFKEININNCINGTVITENCEFAISFNNIGNSGVDCVLKISSNSTVKFINNWIKLKSEASNKCPIIDLNIITIVNGKAKDNKVSTTCGGEIEKLERNFSNFSSFVIKFDTKGLNDQDSTVNMGLVVADPKNSKLCELIVEGRKGYSYLFVPIIITIITVIIVFISSIVILVVYQHHRRKSKYEGVNTKDEDKKSKNNRLDKNC